MASRGGVPQCRGSGTKVAGRPKGGASNRSWLCDACQRVVPINYDGSLRWHTPNPKRGK